MPGGGGPRKRLPLQLGPDASGRPRTRQQRPTMSWRGGRRGDAIVGFKIRGPNCRQGEGWPPLGAGHGDGF